MDYLPYREKQRREQEAHARLVEQLAHTLNNTDLNRDPTGSGAVGKVLNMMQVPPGSDRNRKFGQLMREVKKHPRVIEHMTQIEAEKAVSVERKEQLADARAQLHEKDFESIVEKWPRDAWDGSAD